MWSLLICCARTPEPPAEPAIAPAADPAPAEDCQARCERESQARAVAWEQVVADCRAACAEPAEDETIPASYTGVVTRHLTDEGEELHLVLPDGRRLPIREGVEVQVGREASLAPEQVVLE